MMQPHFDSLLKGDWSHFTKRFRIQLSFDDFFQHILFSTLTNKTNVGIDITLYVSSPARPKRVASQPWLELEPDNNAGNRPRLRG